MTTKNPPNPKKRYGDKKVPLQLVPPAAAISIARGLQEGARKYGAWNWRENAVEFMTYVGSAKRHIDAMLEGEWEDPDSQDGKLHIDGALASLAILADAVSFGNLIDDRPPSNLGALLLLKEEKDHNL